MHGITLRNWEKKKWNYRIHVGTVIYIQTHEHVNITLFGQYAICNFYWYHPFINFCWIICFVFCVCWINEAFLPTKSMNPNCFPISFSFLLVFSFRKFPERLLDCSTSQHFLCGRNTAIKLIHEKWNRYSDEYFYRIYQQGQNDFIIFFIFYFIAHLFLNARESYKIRRMVLCNYMIK